MQRETLLARVTSTQLWDIVIIGGGATGLGIAVDAASRGHKTLLLEAYDFAKGTSSRATKLVHGGVRDLAQGNLSLVYEALHERGRLRNNAPHLVRVMPHVVPAYNLIDMPFYGAGLLLYSVMAGRLGFGFSRLISRTEALKLAPTLTPNGLKGGIGYYDGQFDDSRLAITLMRTATNHGATLLNHMPVDGLLHDSNGKICGVTARDSESGTPVTINAKAVINATGIFVDQIRRLDNAAAKPLLAQSQGIHIVVDRSFLPGDHAVMIPKTADGRVLLIQEDHTATVTLETDLERGSGPQRRLLEGKGQGMPVERVRPHRSARRRLAGLQPHRTSGPGVRPPYPRGVRPASAPSRGLGRLLARGSIGAALP
jgi:glycerol-3-phosphate dehydrogenase